MFLEGAHARSLVVDGKIDNLLFLHFNSFHRIISPGVELFPFSKGEGWHH